MAQRPPAPPTEQLLDMLLAQSQDYAMFLMNPEAMITDWFRAAERVFGYTADEMVGQPFRTLFNQEDLARGADRHELEVARSTGRSEDDRWHVRKDGTLFWGSGLTIALRDLGGEVVGYAKIARNRTDLKTQTEVLERERNAFARRNEEGRNFLGILGHELRNPLTPMVNALALIHKAPADPNVLEQALRILDRQVSILSRLAEDVLEATRVTVGKVDLRLRDLDLREVLRGVIDGALPQAQARRQSLQCVFIDSAVMVHGDADRLHQVFQNIVGNAIKYTPPGGRIAVHVSTEGGDSVTRVEDNGIGMNADVLPTVFDLFTQEDASRKASGDGLGLGLPLVRELVSLHAGTVQARSDGRDKGSVFTVRLPLRGTTQT